MNALIAAACIALLLTLTCIRLFTGPTLYDRTLAANGAALQAALICAALGVAFERADWIDVSFALVLCVLVLNAALLKFFRARTFQAPLFSAGEEAR